MDGELVWSVWSLRKAEVVVSGSRDGRWRGEETREVGEGDVGRREEGEGGTGEGCQGAVAFDWVLVCGVEVALVPGECDEGLGETLEFLATAAVPGDGEMEGGGARWVPQASWGSRGRRDPPAQTVAFRSGRPRRVAESRTPRDGGRRRHRRW